MDDKPEEHWITRLVPDERERRETNEILRAAALTLQASLTNAVKDDMLVYGERFQDEFDNIHIIGSEQDSDGFHWSVIRRIKGYHPDATYIGGSPEARFRINIDTLTVECCFPCERRLDKKFRLIRDENGQLALVEGSLASLSEYLLKPVLFPELAHRVILDDPGVSQGDPGSG